MFRQLSPILILCGGIAAAGPTAAFSHWNDLRASAVLPAGTVTIRTESAQGLGLVNTILYAQGGVQEAPLSLVPDGPSTLEATVPGPATGRRYYGFRLVQPGALDLLPVRLTDGVTPSRTDLTRLAVDPAGDEAFGRVNLDLTDCRIGRHGTRLFAALINAGGGFPVSSGLTFFSYLLGINNPADSDPDTVFALIHTITAAGIIAPGLYQINGTGIDDLVKIGDITATVLPGENTLLLSCELSDLEANPVFQGWYDPDDPRLSVAGFSQRITVLGGAQEADQTPGGVWHLREVALDPGANQLPQLSDLTLPAAGTGAAVSVVYSDADGHCPVIAELVFDGDVVFPLRPQTLDYGAPVVYRSDPGLPPVEAGDWAQVAARFSDDLGNVVELAQAAVGVDDAFPALQLRSAPNPFNPTTMIEYVVPVDGRVMLGVYDVRGSLVRVLVDADLARGSHRATWDGRDALGRGVASGGYFARLEAGGRGETVRMSLVR